MSTKDISQLAKEIKELTRMKEELDAEITALQDSIKAEMLCRGVDELAAGEYKIRWTAVTTNRFDSTAFRKTYAGLYSQFLKQTQTRRFSIA